MEASAPRAFTKLQVLVKCYLVSRLLGVAAVTALQQDGNSRTRSWAETEKLQGRSQRWCWGGGPLKFPGLGKSAGKRIRAVSQPLSVWGTRALLWRLIVC